MLLRLLPLLLPVGAFLPATPCPSQPSTLKQSAFLAAAPYVTLPRVPAYSRPVALQAAGGGAETQKKKKGLAADQGRMELLCKAGPDGVSLGDCPFAHFVQMVLRFKGLRYRLVPLSPEDKPEWLIEGYGGKMPCLVHDEEAYTDSATIAQYLEYFFPSEPPLALEDEELEAKIKAATGGVFAAFAKYTKNLDKTQNDALREALWAELEKIDAHLKEVGGPFLAGERLTLDDLALAPKLYHIKVAVAHFKNVIIPPSLDALADYMKVMFSLDIFRDSAYPPDVIIWGWNNARGTGVAK